MAFKKHNPGCPCCGEICLIQSNDLKSIADLTNNFTLVDAANFAYAASPGGIEISAASQTATANTPHPQSPYPPRVQIEFYGDNIGSQVRVILSEKIIAQVTVGDDCSELDLLDSSEAELTDTLIMPYVDRNEWHRLTVCYDPDTGIVKATVYDLTQDLTYNLDASYSGDALTAYAAFGTGPSHVDNVYVRNFRFWRLWYCGVSPYTSDCHIEGDDWDYYYELPERLPCFDCYLCEVINEDFSKFPDGEMPCSWGGTDLAAWAVSDGGGVGEGEITHTFDTSVNSYIVTATFTIAEMPTLGDETTITLTYGSASISITVTKVVGAGLGSPDRYSHAFTPSGFGGPYYTDDPQTITLMICPGSVGSSIATNPEYLSVAFSPGAVDVTVNQPTESKHGDTTLDAFTITKSNATATYCPECPYTTNCDYCEEPQTFPISSVVEIDGFGPASIFPCASGCDDLNGAFYMSGSISCLHALQLQSFLCGVSSVGYEMTLVLAPGNASFYGLAGSTGYPLGTTDPTKLYLYFVHRIAIGPPALVFFFAKEMSSTLDPIDCTLLAGTVHELDYYGVMYGNGDKPPTVPVMGCDFGGTSVTVTFV